MHLEETNVYIHSTWLVHRTPSCHVHWPISTKVLSLQPITCRTDTTHKWLARLFPRLPLVTWCFEIWLVRYCNDWLVTAIDHFNSFKLIRHSFQFSFFSSETSSFFFPNILPFNFANIALTLPMGPGFFLGSTASNLREERLWNEPNAMATTVQAKQMTLYGILKSGVGRVIRRISVWRRRNTSSFGVVSRLDKKKTIMYVFSTVVVLIGDTVNK